MKPVNQFYSTAFYLFICSILLPGCSSSPDDSPELGNVSGVITMDGEPLSGVTVTFQPTDGGRASQATTGEDGSYTLAYSSTEYGAKVGMHKVTINSPPPSDDELDLKSQEIPAKYNTNSELGAEVKAGDNPISFTLESK